ncbi:EamA family transporter [Clostridiales bacterium F-3ap]|uniref:EamA family transporter n=2 Tax=Anaerotalea alkaliphila TaxID=2662126 RepID=A0A7X5HX58_9FIRM|nr:EamA family transporter [Anaerotalea alkaliphila]
MLKYTLPILLVVSSNIIYHVSSKTTPRGANPFASLLVTYLLAGTLTALLLLVDSAGRQVPVLEQFRNVNHTAALLGVAIVGLEFGYLMVYRAGWNISLGSLVANISLAASLVVVGVLFFGEKLTSNHAVGILLCIAGLVFINRG